MDSAAKEDGPAGLAAARGLAQSLAHHAHHACSVVWDSGSWCSGLAALLFAINALLVKLLGDRVPTSEVVLVRSIISLAFCAYAAHTKAITPFFGHVRHMHLLLARGTFGAAAMQTFYLSITLLPLADAVTLFFFNPAVTTLAAWLILREYLGLVGAGGVLLSLGGLVLLTQPPFLFGHADNWDHKRTLGTIFGLVSALFAAGAFISIRLIGNKEPPLVMSVWFHGMAMLSSTVPLALGYMGSAVWPGPGDCAILFAIGVNSFVAQMVLSRGFQLLPAAKASAINFTQVVWSYVFGVAFLHERISWLGVLGSLLIAAGAVMVSVRRAAKPGPGPGQGQQLAAPPDPGQGQPAPQAAEQLATPPDPDPGQGRQTAAGAEDEQCGGTGAEAETDAGALEEGRRLLTPHSSLLTDSGQPAPAGADSSASTERVQLMPTEAADSAPGGARGWQPMPLEEDVVASSSGASGAHPMPSGPDKGAALAEGPGSGQQDGLRRELWDLSAPELRGAAAAALPAGRSADEERSPLLCCITERQPP